jgi:hypothetical protein
VQALGIQARAELHIAWCPRTHNELGRPGIDTGDDGTTAAPVDVFEPDYETPPVNRLGGATNPTSAAHRE